MSIEYCDYCHKHIDTDNDAEHFDEDGLCVEQEEEVLRNDDRYKILK